MRLTIVRVLLFVLIVWPIQASAEVITPPDGQHDAGTIYQGDSVAHTFRIRNTFGRPFTVERIVASCACVRKEGESKTYQPGELIEIDLRFGPQGAGAKTQTVHVVPVDQSLPTLRLTIRASVLARLRLDPPAIKGKMADCDASEPFIVNVRIMGEAAPPRLARIVAIPPVVNCALKPQGAEGRDYHLHVSPRPGLPRGRHAGSIKFYGEPRDEADAPPLLGEVPFDFTVESGPRIMPASLDFSVIRRSGRPRLTRYLTLDFPDGVQFLDAEPKPDFLTVEETPSEGARRILLIRLNPERFKGGPLSGEIVIRYRDANGSENSSNVEVKAYVMP